MAIILQQVENILLVGFRKESMKQKDMGVNAGVGFLW
jgi:hypothetical protein